MQQAGDEGGRGGAVSKILPGVEAGMSLREDGTMITTSPMAPRPKEVGRRQRLACPTAVTLSLKLASPTAVTLSLKLASLTAIRDRPARVSLQLRLRLPH